MEFTCAYYGSTGYDVRAARPRLNVFQLWGSAPQNVLFICVAVGTIIAKIIHR